MHTVTGTGFFPFQTVVHFLLTTLCVQVLKEFIAHTCFLQTTPPPVYTHTQKFQQIPLSQFLVEEGVYAKAEKFPDKVQSPQY